MDAHLLTPLGTLEDRLNTFLHSITTSPTAANAPTATLALLEADDALTAALDTLRIHQANYTKIRRLRTEAAQLEERVKGIVREIEAVGEEIETACGDDARDHDSDSDADEDADYDDGGKRLREVDYRLLLDFARRISRYNNEAAANAADGGAPAPQRARDGEGDDVEMSGTGAGQEVNGNSTDGQGVSAVTKNATNWLEEAANWTRGAHMTPFPTEERIRAGIMGDLQRRAAEGVDPDVEAEKMVAEAEGRGVDPPRPGDGVSQPTGAMETGSDVGAGPVGTASAPATAPIHVPMAVPNTSLPPKPKLDLDLYDPDDDDE